MNLHPIRSILLIFLWLYITDMHAIDDKYYQIEKRIFIQKGLSQSRILSIIEDERGFMWFGTADGLNRYDGYTTKIFRHRINDKSSLPNNFINSMVEDQDGNIWVGTKDGVVLFNPYTETFVSLRETDSAKNELGANLIASCALDSNQDLWCGTFGYGIFKIDHNTFEKHYFLYSTEDSLYLNHISKIFIDSQNHLWLGAFHDNMMISYNISTDELNSYPMEGVKASELKQYRPTAFFEDSKHRIWVGLVDYMSTKGSLYYKESGQSVFKNYKDIIESDFASIYFDSFNSIVSITGNKEGQYWFASLLSGIFSFKFGETPVASYVVSPQKDATINCLCLGSNNILWIGTNGYGVELSIPDNSDFNLISSRINSEFPIASIRAFDEDDHYYWVGGYNGLVKISKDFEKFETVYMASIYTLAGDLQDKNLLWAGSEGGGLLKYDKKKNLFTQVELNSGKLDDFNIKYIYKIVPYSDTLLLIGTGQGLIGYNPQKQTVTPFHFLSNQGTSLDIMVSTIFRDRSGNILIGYVDGKIGRLDMAEQVVKNFSVIPGLQDINSFNPINCIYQDTENNYWIATTNGLIQYDVNTAKLRLYTEDDGLPNSFIYGILPDKSGNLWLSTNNGISSFSPKDQLFRNFDVSDGLQSNEFNTGAFFEDDNGMFFFGGIGGFNYFNPTMIRQNSIQPAIQITDIKVNNQYLTLSKEEIATHQLEIQPDEEIITIDFSGLSFINNNKNKYKYKINELNEDWIDLGNYHQITFNNLAPGKYTLEILASNNHGLWLNKPYAFSIVVLPTFFESVFFKWLIGILILVLIFVGIQIRLRQLIKQKSQLQLFADKQTESLVATNDTLKNVIKELKTTTSELEMSNKTKEKFLSIIAHDLMGPLGVIEGFSDMLNKKEYQFTESEMADYIETINTSAKGLISLLSNLLHWSRLQRKSLKINPTAILLKNIIDETVNLLQGNIKNKEIELSVLVDEQDKVLADYNMLSTILRNLISNAVKFTSSKGKIIIDSKSKDQQVLISIADTGVGIADEILSKLFNPEEFVTTKGTNNESGTGLGLNLVSEFVTLNKGTIEIKSQVNVGTTFYLTFPKPMQESENSVISS